MKTIEYGEHKIKVPESWEDIPLGDYEQVYNLKPDTNRERVALIAKICKIDADTLLSWPAEIFNLIVGCVGFLYEDNPVTPSQICEIDGIKYIVPVEDELSLGAWVDVDEVQKAGVNVLSNVLAIVCRPAGETYDYKNNEQRRAMYATQPTSNVLGVMAFFLRCKVQSAQLTATLGTLQRMADLLPPNIKLLRSLGDGIRLSRMWRIMKFYCLIKLLRYRLRKFSHSYNIGRTRNMPTMRNAS